MVAVRVFIYVVLRVFLNIKNNLVSIIIPGMQQKDAHYFFAPVAFVKLFIVLYFTGMLFNIHVYQLPENKTFQGINRLSWCGGS